MSADFRIRLAHSPADAAVISAVFDEVWSVKTMVSPEIIVASLHNGGYGAIVESAGVPIGAAFALVGVPLAGETGPNLHSHAAGVVAHRAGHGIGEAIKLHQWRWAKDNGFATVTWTFDPLVRRNAWFNIVKLGVRVLGYHTNFYGELDDGINAGEQSDRVLVRWEVAALGEPHRAAFIEVGPDDIVIPTPSDIESLRLRDREESTRWRDVQRAAFLDAQSRGAVVVGLNEEYDYVLRLTHTRPGTPT